MPAKQQNTRKIKQSRAQSAPGKNRVLNARNAANTTVNLRLDVLVAQIQMKDATIFSNITSAKNAAHITHQRLNLAEIVTR